MMLMEDNFGLWFAKSVSSNIPYLNLLLLNTGQAVVAVFLSSEFLKRDKKLDTSEVFYVRPLSNAEYVIGKIWGNLRVFLLLNLLVLAIVLAFNFMASGITVDWQAYGVYFLLISLPTLIFIIGLSIFLMLFLLLAGLVLPSFWKSQKKEASGNKGREPAKETTETNSDTPMPEYLDFDALKAFFSDSQIASLKGQFPVYLKEYVKKEQTSITFLPEKTSYPTETTVCLMFSLSDQDTLPVTYHTPTGVFLFGEDGVQVSADTTVYEKQTDDSLPSLTSQDIEHLQEGGYPDTSDSPEAPDTESGSASVPSEDAKDTKKEVQP